MKMAFSTCLQNMLLNTLTILVFWSPRELTSFLLFSSLFCLEHFSNYVHFKETCTFALTKSIVTTSNCQCCGCHNNEAGALMLGLIVVP